MLTDTLFRIVNIAGGLGQADDLWRRQVLGPRPAKGQTGDIRRRIEAALMQGGTKAAEEPAVRSLCRTPG